MNLVDAAMLIALEAHGGDRNKHDGEIYTRHLARVWINVRNAGGTEIQQAIAWLHDSIEDTTLDYAEMRQYLMGMSDAMSMDIDCVVQGVRAMTKLEGESDLEYFLRVKEVPNARFVKLKGDMVDNFRRNHKIKDEAKRLKLGARYSLGTDVLTES